MKRLSKKQWCLFVAIVVVGVGGAFVYSQNQSRVQAAEAKKELSVSQTQLNSFQKKVEGLFDQKDPDFLAKGIKEDQIEALQKEVTEKTTLQHQKNGDKAAYKAFDQQAGKTKERLNQASKKWSTLNTVNKLYQSTDKSTAISGSDVNKDLPIVDDLKKETVESATKAYFTEGATKAYDKAVNDLLRNAEQQVTQIEKAKTAVEQVFKNDNVISTDTKAYDSAKTEVDTIKNEKAKKDLQDKLGKVKADIDKKAQEEANAAQATQAQEQASAQSQQATQGNAGTQNAGNSTTSNAPGTTDDGSAGSTATGGGYTSGGYTPPASNGGGQAAAPQAPAPNPTPQAPSRPAAGGNADGSLTQEQGNQAAEDAGNSDWSSFFP